MDTTHRASSTLPDGDERRIEAIEADITRARADMTRTIDAIEHRLDPRQLIDRAKATLKDNTVGRIAPMMDSASDTATHLAGKAKDTAETVADHVKDNPMPAALLGLGMGWLLYSLRSSPETGAMRSAISNHPLPALMVGAGLGWLLCNAFTEPARPGAGFYPAREPQDIGQRISSIAGSAQESVRDAAERARVEVSRYSGKFQNDVGRMLRQNPLAFGVAALAAGAAVGMSLPVATRDRARERLLGRDAGHAGRPRT